MVIVMKKNAAEDEIDQVIKWIESVGYQTHPSRGVEQTIIGVVGDDRGKAQLKSVEYLPGVEKVVPILKPYKLASREFKKENTVIEVGGVKIGGKKIVVMAGPCAVESREIVLETAKQVKKAGAVIFRGGAFKPRSSPYSFQGLGKTGLEYLLNVRKVTGMGTVSEAMTVDQVDLVAKYCDIVQIGARNVQNYDLLKAAGRQKKPVLLKRGRASTIKELLLSAEYIMSQGNYDVILCERGIRTFEDATRFTLDLNAVPVLKKLSHLPVFVDPSHGIGIREHVPVMAKAGIAAGADGLILEVHPKPEEALSDGPQSLLPAQFAQLMKELKVLAKALGRDI